MAAFASREHVLEHAVTRPRAEERADKPLPNGPSRPKGPQGESVRKGFEFTWDRADAVTA